MTSGDIEILKIETTKQLGDIFTKGLVAEKFTANTQVTMWMVATCFC